MKKQVKKVRELTQSEKMWRRFNGFRAIIWTGVIPVAYFWGWVASVTFVAVCSLYANVASDVAAWRSDVNPQLDDIEEKIDEVLERLDKLESK
jgi:hypothetical protein